MWPLGTVPCMLSLHIYVYITPPHPPPPRRSSFGGGLCDVGRLEKTVTLNKPKNFQILNLAKHCNAQKKLRLKCEFVLDFLEVVEHSSVW